jgi:hypothetical protein
MAALFTLFFSPLGVFYFSCVFALQLFLLPAYAYQRKLGHPSWVMIPTLLPVWILYALIKVILAPHWWFYSTVGSVICLLICLSLWMPFLVYKPTIFKRVLLAFFLILMVLAETALASYSRCQFLRDLYSVRTGMSADAVEAIMGQYLEFTDLPPLPGGNEEPIQLGITGAGAMLTIDESEGDKMAVVGSRFYRHDNSADVGIVRFEDYRVVSVEFSPD